MKKITLMAGLLLMMAPGCVKKDRLHPVNPTENGSPIENMQPPASFDFRTSDEVDVRITTMDNSDRPVPNIRVMILTDYTSSGGAVMAAFVTGADGVFSGKIKVPERLDSLVIHTDALGFVQEQKRLITNHQLTCVLGGKRPVQILRPAGPPAGNQPVVVMDAPLGNTTVVRALGRFNALGVPNYLESPNDVIDASFINDINTALPENRPVPTFHPEYLTQTNQTNLQFLAESDVWVTFVHEGAGYRNVLCYYTYDVNSPPLTVADIDTLHVIFPNVSYVNSGGGLVSGNKVRIGTFRPGTVVGWAIIANGYNGTAVTGGVGTYYSNQQLNPETNVNLKKHCILLNDVNREKFLLSFEDLNRQAGADNDFNDAVFYVTSNPVQGIVVSDIPLPGYNSVDTDRDGVTDLFDDYPQDATKAFNNYYPAQGTSGTLAFEDLWPSRGDYDFNDLVMDYQFNYITNADNEVTQIKAALTVKAIGASYHNGFGIQLPINPSLVAGVAGTDVRGTGIQRNSNGTEAGQSKATIIVFDDAFNELPWPGSGIGVNTTPGATYVQPTTLNITITLSAPVSVSTLGLPPYNPFIFTNRVRESEVHLPNKPPTDLANQSLLGSQHDNSRPAEGRFYVTARNLPFAIDIVTPFDYPVEKTVITDAHLMFFTWGQSGGSRFKDWYIPRAGYRNDFKVYKR